MPSEPDKIVACKRTSFERRLIGDRTEAALAVLKSRGIKLGMPANLDHAGRLNGARTAAKNRTAQAIDEMSDVAELAAGINPEGATLAAIAAALDAEGYLTRKGTSWSATQVKRVLDRAAGKVPCRCHPTFLTTADRERNEP
jgi:hypothetical protein